MPGRSMPGTTGNFASGTFRNGTVSHGIIRMVMTRIVAKIRLQVSSCWCGQAHYVVAAWHALLFRFSQGRSNGGRVPLVAKEAPCKKPVNTVITAFELSKLFPDGHWLTNIIISTILTNAIHFQLWTHQLVSGIFYIVAKCSQGRFLHAYFRNPITLMTD